MSDAAPPPEPRSETGRTWLVPGIALGVALLLAVGAAVHVIRRASLAVAPPEPVDFAGWTIPQATVVAAAPRHAIPPLVEPRTLSLEEAASFKIGRRGKYLVGGDLVVGVAVGEDACAYPVRVLEWHEVVQHDLGGVPLAVTYHPLSGAAAAFDRRLPGRSRPLDLRASGLLWQSTLLLVDAAPVGAAAAEESLWSQVLGRAVAGPAAADPARLSRVACELTHWSDWAARHPRTRVIAPDPARISRLKQSPYGSYLGNDLLQFPVDPAPPEGGLPNKERVLAVEAGGLRQVYPYSLIEARAAGGQWQVEQGGVALTFRWLPSPVPPHPPAATVIRPDGEPLRETVPCYWFAWYAVHGGEVELAGGGEESRKKD